MDKVENLKDLFIATCRELYDASRQEEKELPRLQEKVEDGQLRKLIDQRLSLANHQSERVKDVARKYEVSSEGEKNLCCQAVFKQTAALLERSNNPQIKDAIILQAIQRLNHNRMAELGTLTAYAREMGQEGIADSFFQARQQYQAADHDLNTLAEKEINNKALKAMPVE